MVVLRRIVLDLLAPGALGALAAFGFAPFGVYVATIFALAGLIALWWPANPRRAAWRGFVFGLGLFGAGLHWPYVSIHQFGHAPAALAVALTGLLIVYLALYPAAVGAFAGATRCWPRPLWALVLVPGAWLFSELARGWLGTGFPWLALGYPLIDSPAAAIAPIAGVYALGFLLAAAAATLCLLVAGSLTGRAIAVVIIGLTPVAVWWVPAPGHWTQPTGDALSATIIQGNFGEAIKSRPETLAPTLIRYRRLTRQSDADIVLWPETAVPVPAARVQPYLGDIAAAARAKQQTVLTGALVAHDESYYNAVIALGRGQGRYYKRHLVPFGEYFPVPDFVKQWMDGVQMKYGSLAFGPSEQPLIEANGVKLGVSICFEDVFPREIAKALPAAGLLVNVTNDAWFAGTIGPAQHLQIARMRALEAGRPMLRAANTGISAVIGYAGRLRRASAQFEVATLDAKRVQPRAGTTPYVRVGNAPLWLAAGILVGVALLGALIERRYVARTA